MIEILSAERCIDCDKCIEVRWMPCSLRRVPNEGTVAFPRSLERGGSYHEVVICDEHA